MATAMTNPLKDMNPPSAEGVRNLLRRIIDPEVGVNIVDLGLIYDIDADDGTIRVEMTMTSPACPMGEMIIDDAYAELDRILPDECQPEIRIVWEPPWNPSMMSEKCRLRLGWNEPSADQQ